MPLDQLPTCTWENYRLVSPREMKKQLLEDPLLYLSIRGREVQKDTAETQMHGEPKESI